MSELWQKARSAAGQAQLLFAAGEYDGACSRAYYAMFNAARALLIMRGVSPRKAKRHATVLRLFSLHFVQAGPFSEDDGRALRRAGDYRNIADYDEVDIGRTRATEVMDTLEKFMKLADRVMKGPAEESDQ